MKLQFSENIKTIIKIQRFSNWMAVNAEFFSAAFLFLCFEIQKKIIYQIMRVHQTQTEPKPKQNGWKFFNIQIYIFLCWFTFYLFIFCESSNETAANVAEEKARRNKRFTLNWLSFKCLWFFINFAVAFHPFFDVWKTEGTRDMQGKRSWAR